MDNLHRNGDNLVDKSESNVEMMWKLCGYPIWHTESGPFVPPVPSTGTVRTRMLVPSDPRRSIGFRSIGIA